jgi:5-methylcytosine-specific restriction endonuclease McrA
MRNRAIVLREEDTCALCGRAGQDNDTVDHVTPLANGGTNERHNLQRAHAQCNARKNARNRVYGSRQTAGPVPNSRPRRRRMESGAGWKG